ncbi:MAG: hypothetical protein SGBAC_008743 [Bacillariaceae sp.]
MFSWSASAPSPEALAAETDTTLSQMKLPLTAESTTTTATTVSAAAASKAAAAAAVQDTLTDTTATADVAKSWFRDIFDAVLLVALLHLVNLGFRWWNEKHRRRRLRRQQHPQPDKKAPSTASVTTHTSASSSLMKGGKYSGRFASGIKSKMKKKKNARFQLSTEPSTAEDITSTTRTSNLTNGHHHEEEEGSASESTHNSNNNSHLFYTRYGTLQQRSNHERNRRASKGRTWTIPQGGKEGMLPVILNFATSTLEECLDQVDLLDVQDEAELVDIVLKCCAQERLYFENYGAVAAYLCHNNNSMKTTPRHSNVGSSIPRYPSPRVPRSKRSSKWREALEFKFVSCYRKETKKLRKLRNMGMFFAHLLITNAISYQIFDIVKLSNATTTTASRYFLKILLKELAHHLTPARLQRRIQEFPHAFAGLVLLNPRPVSSGGSTGSMASKSRRTSFTSTTSTLTSNTSHSVLLNSKNMKFAIQFLTEIGLKTLTMDMREHLVKIDKEQREQRQRQRKHKMKGYTGGSQPSLVSDSDNSNAALLYDEVTQISNHSVVTDEASSAASSSINSTSIQSNSGRCYEDGTDDRLEAAGMSSQHSVISQLSTSTRSRSTSLRATAMSTPHSKTSFNRSTPSDNNSFCSRETLGSSTKKVRTSHRKLSRRIVPHTPNLARNVAAPQTPKHFKRRLFGSTPPRVSKSLSPKPSSSRVVARRLPTAPNINDVESVSSSDSEILPKPRTGAVGVDDVDKMVFEVGYNHIRKEDDSDEDDELNDDLEDESYDIYYGDHNLGPSNEQGHQMESLLEDTDGSVDTFQLPSDDEDEDHAMKDDFQVTGRRNVLFRKRPSIINE